MAAGISERGLAILAWLNVCVIWGTTYLAIRIGVGRMPPMLFAGLRWVAAGGAFLAFLAWRGKPIPRPKEALHLAVIGLALVGCGNGLVVFAEQWIPSGLAALMIATVPFFLVGMESLLPQGRRVNGAILLGLFLGLGGALLIFGEDLRHLADPGQLAGVLGLLGAVFFWSLGSLYAKTIRLAVHPLMGAAVQMLIAGAVLSAIGLLLGEAARLHVEADGILALAYLVFVGSLIGYSSYIYAIAKLPLSLVSTYAYINPLIALVLGWAVLDEPLTLRVALAAAVILAGVFLVQRGNARLNGSR